MEKCAAERREKKPVLLKSQLTIKFIRVHQEHYYFIKWEQHSFRRKTRWMQHLQHEENTESFNFWLFAIETSTINSGGSNTDKKKHSKWNGIEYFHRSVKLVATA